MLNATSSSNFLEFSALCQSPVEGPFDSNSLQWFSSDAIETPTSTCNAIIPFDRVEVFIAGEDERGTCIFSKSRKVTKEDGSLIRVEKYSYLQSQDYHCEFGPNDHSVGTAACEELQAKWKGKGML